KPFQHRYRFSPWISIRPLFGSYLCFCWHHIYPNEKPRILRITSNHLQFLLHFLSIDRGIYFFLILLFFSVGLSKRDGWLHDRDAHRRRRVRHCMGGQVRCKKRLTSSIQIQLRIRLLAFAPRSPSGTFLSPQCRSELSSGFPISMFDACYRKNEMSNVTWAFSAPLRKHASKVFPNTST